jgi:hypothetical protein
MATRLPYVACSVEVGQLCPPPKTLPVDGNEALDIYIASRGRLRERALLRSSCRAERATVECGGGPERHRQVRPTTRTVTSRTFAQRPFRDAPAASSLYIRDVVTSVLCLAIGNLAAGPPSKWSSSMDSGASR